MVQRYGVSCSIAAVQGNDGAALARAGLLLIGRPFSRNLAVRLRRPAAEPLTPAESATQRSLAGDGEGRSSVAGSSP
jgi:hypothetical protein